MSKTKCHEYVFCSLIINDIIFIKEGIAKGCWNYSTYAMTGYTLMYSLNASAR